MAFGTAGMASADGSASHVLVGVVEPVVGVAIDADGTISGSTGTMDVTVTREQLGGRTVVTVIPR
jgi:hypothetical protein